MQDIIFYATRILLGGFFIKNAYGHFKNLSSMAQYAASKKVPAPKAAVFGTGVLLLIAGIGILFWIYVPIAVVAGVLFLIPVTFTMHSYWKEADPMARMNQNINFYKNLAILGGTIVLLLI